jgi:hypothetical protein
MKTVAAIVLGIALALSGCGKSASHPSTSSAPPTSAAPVPTGSTVGLGALSENCQKVAAALSSAGQGFGSSLPAGSTPSAYANQASDALRAVATQAPSGSVRDAFNTLADAYKKFADDIAGVNYDPHSGGAPPAAYLSAVQAFAQPSFAQASSTVTQWITANCSH